MVPILLEIPAIDITEGDKFYRKDKRNETRYRKALVEYICIYTSFFEGLTCIESYSVNASKLLKYH